MKSAMTAAPEKSSATTPAPRHAFDVMRSLTNEMDRWFADFWAARPRSLTAWPQFREEGLWNPAIEVDMREGKLIVRADLPGLTKGDVKVDVTDDVLTIEGERKHEEEKKEEGYYRSERSYGHFCRTVALPEGAKPETAKATFKDGVLEIAVDVPTQKTPEARRVEIN